MMTVVPLRELKRELRLTPVQVRIPREARTVAQQLAKEQSTNDVRLTETDVYRTAILNFLSNFSTKSRDSETE